VPPPPRRPPFAFASPMRLSHPSVLTITNSRNGHAVLRAASEEGGKSEERKAKLLEERKEQLRVLLSASKGEIDKLVRQNPNVLKCSDIQKNHGPKSEAAAGEAWYKRKGCRSLVFSSQEVVDQFT